MRGRAVGGAVNWPKVNELNLFLLPEAVLVTSWVSKGLSNFERGRETHRNFGPFLPDARSQREEGGTRFDFSETSG